MPINLKNNIYDYVITGSGPGGSIPASLLKENLKVYKTIYKSLYIDYILIMNSRITGIKVLIICRIN